MSKPLIHYVFIEDILERLSRSDQDAVDEMIDRQLFPVSGTGTRGNFPGGCAQNVLRVNTMFHVWPHDDGVRFIWTAAGFPAEVLVANSVVPGVLECYGWSGLVDLFFRELIENADDLRVAMLRDSYPEWKPAPGFEGLHRLHIGEFVSSPVMKDSCTSWRDILKPPAA